jgi:DNA-binding transcriptional LysR family regulator
MVRVDRFAAMTAFVTVADLRGFLPAARRLRLSPSAVTRLVAALEEKLGARLLQRTTRSVTLTDAGSRYLERARHILSDVDEAERTAGAERTVPTGRFVVTAPNLFGRLHVAPLICDFLREFPAVKGELILGDRIASLVEEGIDAAVRIGLLGDSNDVARNVGATRRVVVASPKYLAKQKKLRSPSDIGAHQVIQCTAISPTAEWRFQRGGEEQRIAFAPAFVTNSADAALRSAELDGGITMILAYQVMEAVRAGRLRVVLSAFEPAPLPIQIVYPTTRLLSAKVRAFIDHVTTKSDWRFVDL